MDNLHSSVSERSEPSSADLCQVDLYYALRRAARDGDSQLPLSVIAEMLVDCFGKDIRFIVNLIAIYDKRGIATYERSF